MKSESIKVKVLIVDDEPDILEFLKYNLVKEGFEVFLAGDGTNAIKIAKAELPGIIILDVMMPGMDGIETCEKLREITVLKHSVIAFLTARGEDYSQLAGFNAGGDDYIIKPVRPKVFVSRINSYLKRMNRSRIENFKNEELVTNGEITIDISKYRVMKGSEEIKLPKREFDILLLLIKEAGKIYKRDDLFNAIWGENSFISDRIIDVYIRKLREKLGESSIQTVKGVGYKFAR